MKRLLSLLLTLLLVLAVFSACSGSKTGETAPVGTSAPQTEPASSEPGEPEPSAAEPFSPVTLLDNDVCAFTVTAVETDEIWGFQVKLRCENRTDASQMFMAPAVSCRGWVISTDWVQMVSAGETRESEFNVFPSALARCGLEQVDECRIHLVVRNPDSYLSEPFADEELVFYPTGLTAEEIAPAGDPPVLQDAAVNVGEEGLYRFYICGSETDTIWPYNLIVCLENDSDRDLTFIWRDVSVSGVGVDLWFNIDVPAGLRTCFLTYFDEDTMAANNIAAIEQVDLTLLVKEKDTNNTLATEEIHYQR